MSNPLVTIITPVYNHEKYLDDYFQSIISQTYSNIELILIDDASPDESKIVIERWLKKLEERFVNIIYIPRIENKGLIYNCNEGISLAKGKYINVFASDDVMLPENIEKKVRYMERNNDYAMVYSDAFSGENPNKSGGKMSQLNTQLEGNIYQELVDRGNFIPAPTAFLKREVIKELGGYSSKYMFEDYPMWLEVAYRYKIGHINKPLVYYRLSPNSLSRGTENYKMMMSSQEQLYKDIQKKYSTDIDLALRNIYITASFFFLRYDRTRYKYYRNKVNQRNLKITICDFLYYLRIPPKGLEYIRVCYSWRKFVLQN